MKQSKFMSLVESVVSILVGFGISVAAQAYFLPLFGVAISLHQNLMFAGVMTVISIARQFVMRRVFEALHIRRPLSPFMQALIAERFRQVETEGWSLDHDDQHEPGELATAGAAYAKQASWHLNNPGLDPARQRRLTMPNWWPWDLQWWKPTEFRRDLVKAGALIVAEGEKFDRNRKQKRRAF
jgi:hypothetical protein